MKLFNFHIIKQKTLDEKLLKARRQVLIVPNKIISLLLARQAEEPMVKQLVFEYRKLQNRYQWLRDRVRNA